MTTMEKEAPAQEKTNHREVFLRSEAVKGMKMTMTILANVYLVGSFLITTQDCVLMVKKKWGE